jgi:cytochrome P450
MGEVAATMPPNTHPQAYYTALAKKYNLEGIFYIDLWPLAPSAVVLIDPELQDQVLVKKPLPQHPLVAEFLGPVVGEKVIAAVNGSLWKTLHKAMVPAFSWSHIRSLTDVIVEECSQFRKALDKLAATSEVFSMEETAAKLIFDVIARIVFNFSLNAQSTGGQQLNDFKEMIAIVESNLDITVKLNPWAQLKLYLRRRKLLGRLDADLSAKINERFDLLLHNKIVPSRKDPKQYSGSYASRQDPVARSHIQRKKR